MQTIHEPRAHRPGGRSLKSLSALLAVALLAGCGVSAKPSASDAKEAIAGLFSTCDHIQVKDFKVTNGAEVEPGRHLVYTTFTLESKPLDANVELYQTTLQRVEEYKPQCDAVPQSAEAVNAPCNEAYARYDELRRYKSYDEQQNNPEIVNALKAQKDACGAAEDWRKQNERLLAECNNGAGDVNSALQQLKGPMYDEYTKTCKINTGSPLTLSLFYKLLGKPEDMAKTTRGEFQVELTMIKTDNGWMMARH